MVEDVLPSGFDLVSAEVLGKSTFISFIIPSHGGRFKPNGFQLCSRDDQ